ALLFHSWLILTRCCGMVLFTVFLQLNYTKINNAKNIMKKFVLIIALSTCMYFMAAAQKGDIGIGAGIDIGLPIGNFGEGYGIGFGASAKGLYGISDAGQVTLTLGFLRFGMKDGSDLVSGSAALIP